MGHRENEVRQTEEQPDRVGQDQAVLRRPGPLPGESRHVRPKKIW